jgi:tRNA pseudouridine38-40 synthase
LVSRFFIRIAYRGTNYNGWQIQTNAKTVQGILNEKLSLLLKVPIVLTGAGRTDTGVNARCFYAHFDYNKLDSKELDKLVYHLNSLLPSDIAVQSIFPVADNAHARFSATSRSYAYYIHSKKDPFLEGISYFYYKSLDVEKMRLACKLLMEFDDFKSFSKNHTDVNTYNCHIFNAEWKVVENQIIFMICADRFLRNMVRAIVGTMLELGNNSKNLDDFRKIILARDRSMAGPSVPPHGLFLVDIIYPEGIFNENEISGF